MVLLTHKYRKGSFAVLMESERFLSFRPSCYNRQLLMCLNVVIFLFQHFSVGLDTLEQLEQLRFIIVCSGSAWALNELLFSCRRMLYPISIPLLKTLEISHSSFNSVFSFNTKLEFRTVQTTGEKNSNKTYALYSGVYSFLNEVDLNTDNSDVEAWSILRCSWLSEVALKLEPKYL